MARTSDFPETLEGTIFAIQNLLPPPVTVPNMTEVFNTQDTMSNDMATHLKSLVDHYEQMVQALHDSEAGEAFEEAELQGTCQCW